MATLITRPMLAQRLNLSQTTVRAMELRGDLPLPLRFGKSAKVVRWVQEEIDEWILAGCPPRELKLAENPDG